MLTKVKEWVEKVLGQGYSYSQGTWIEDGSDLPFCVISYDGGSPTMVNVRRLRVRVLLIGRRNTLGGLTTLAEDADLLIKTALSGERPEGVASIQSVAEKTGPAYTKENRAWTQLSFEVIF